MKIAPDRAEDLCRQAVAAFQRKQNLDTFWQSTADLHYPERADFTEKKTLGEDFASGLYASEPIRYRRDFGNFLTAVLRPRGREWFKPRARRKAINDRSNVQAYLTARGEDTRSLLYDVRSQFVRSNREADHDWVTFGNSVQTIEEHRLRTGFLWRTWHLRDCAWLENYDGEVDTMFRRFEVPIRQLPEREANKGWKMSEKIPERLRKNPDEKIKVLHICMPAQQFYLGIKRIRPTDHQWVSLYIDQTHKHTMSIKPVPWFLYVVSRWFTVSQSPYAFSPCVVASIPDARTLQAMTWSIVEAGEKAVEPPMAATHEAILGPVDLRAGHVTWVDRNYDEKEGVAIRAIELGKHPELGEALRQGLTGSLMEAWHLNRLFLPQTGVAMTAEETSRRHEEFLRASQPIIDPAEEERNGKPLDLIMTMAMRLGYWGDLKQMPEELRGEDIDITYDNPIEDARKQSKTMAFGQVVNITQQAMILDQTLPAHLDVNKAYRDAIGGVAPPDWLVTEDEAAEKAEQMEQQLTEQQGLDQASQVAAMAGDAAKAMPPPEQEQAAA